MRYILRSIATISFWRYALFSGEAVAKLFASVGFLYAFIEMMDFFGIYTKDHYSKYAIVPIFLSSAAYVVFTRRPVTRVSYKVPQKDYLFEVKIGNLFDDSGDVVISTSTTFDTDLSKGLISADSLQGQFALQCFQGNTAEIDRQLDLGLAEVEHLVRVNAPGKTKEYPIGTTAKVNTHGRTFYFVAMSRLNEHGTANSSLRDVEDALTGLWEFIGQQGELRNLAIALMGTGRGRVELPRKKMVEKIAQSFSDASREKIFSNKLAILIRPQDAENFGVNLFEVKDYLTRSLHV